MNRRFSNVESVPLFSIATLLDPRFKKVPFSSSSSCDQARRRLISEMSPPASANPSSTTTTLTATSNQSQEAEVGPQERETTVQSDALWKRFDDMVAAAHDHRSVATEATLECRTYFEERNITRTSNPLTWWKENAARFPMLQRVAKKYLCVPATSVPSERLFSKAGELVSKKRNSIKPKNIDMLLFLNKNIQ